MCYINAGTMVLAPSRELFELLVEDVKEPDPQWHVQAWSPEQKYLSNVMSGEWSHVSQLYNFEVQLHSGVPMSPIWKKAVVSEIAVAHFSGQEKVWDTEPDRELPVLGSIYQKDAFASLPSAVQQLAKARCRLLHAEWHMKYALALRSCRVGLLPSELSSWQPAWRSLLRTGAGREVKWEDSQDVLETANGACWSPGDCLVVEDTVSAVQHLATVLRPKGHMLVLHRERQGDGCSLEGWVESRESQDLRDRDDAEYGLGCKAIAWLGEDNVTGVVVARSGEERLLRIGSQWAWLPVGSLIPCETVQANLQCFW